MHCLVEATKSLKKLPLIELPSLLTVYIVFKFHEVHHHDLVEEVQFHGYLFVVVFLLYPL